VPNPHRRAESVEQLWFPRQRGSTSVGIVRDRRVSRDEEKRLLDTALGVMNTAAHRHVGGLLHDRISARWSSAAGVARCC
jgi:hypothetical protein